MAALLAGQGVSAVAREYRIPKSVVCGWKAGLSPLEVERVRTEKADEFGELLASYLRKLLVALQVQADHTASVAWLREQSASELATLHGVMCDKGLRILEAAERANGDD